MMFFLKGLIVGLSIAAPVGPIGILCIRRTLANGRAAGFLSGLGAATADAMYGAAAGFGLTVVASVLVGGQQWLRLVGGLFLLYLGIRTWRTAGQGGAGSITSDITPGLLGAYASTLALTLTNPMTILSFAAIFAGLGVAAGARYASAAALVAGVFCGSALWWFTLSTVVGALRHHLSTSGVQWVSRASGAIIAAFGVQALMTVL
jgi:threonine/homoserine/homoserine lactone efflux protein